MEAAAKQSKREGVSVFPVGFDPYFDHLMSKK